MSAILPLIPVIGSNCPRISKTLPDVVIFFSTSCSVGRDLWLPNIVIVLQSIWHDMVKPGLVADETLDAQPWTSGSSNTLKKGEVWQWRIWSMSGQIDCKCSVCLASSPDSFTCTWTNNMQKLNVSYKKRRRLVDFDHGRGLVWHALVCTCIMMLTHLRACISSSR